MRVLLIHNRYQQPGGEDAVFATEKVLLRQREHEVFEYVENNHRINNIGWSTAALQTVWSRPTHKNLAQILHKTCADLVHFHNTFLLISPSGLFSI